MRGLKTIQRVFYIILSKIKYFSSYLKISLSSEVKVNFIFYLFYYFIYLFCKHRNRQNRPNPNRPEIYPALPRGPDKCGAVRICGPTKAALWLVESGLQIVAVVSACCIFTAGCQSIWTAYCKRQVYSTPWVYADLLRASWFLQAYSSEVFVYSGCTVGPLHVACGPTVCRCFFADLLRICWWSAADLLRGRWFLRVHCL